MAQPQNASMMLPELLGKAGGQVEVLTCCSLSNGSQGNEQYQQLRAGEVQQAWGLPSGEEEGCKDSHVNDHDCC